MKKTLLLILGLTVTAQFLIPASMILKHERILRKGTAYRFKTRPIDPADPFLGRYVRLQFENDYIVAPTNAIEPAYNELIYVTLNTDADGYCELTGWSRNKPKNGDWLKLKYWHRTTFRAPGEQNKLRFSLPFNRFYMEESKAPRAEKIARRSVINLSDPASTNLSTNCWAEVRVWNGAALIEDVLIDGTAIRDLAGQSTE